MRQVLATMLVLTFAIAGCASSGRVETLENRVEALQAQDRADAERLSDLEAALASAQTTAAESVARAEAAEAQAREAAAQARDAAGQADQAARKADAIFKTSVSK